MSDTLAGGAPAGDPTPAPTELPVVSSPPLAPDPAPTPAPAPAPVPAPKTLATGDAPDIRLQVTADFPENWREKMAGDDAKFLDRLKRFNSPADVAKSYRELEGKISSGEYKATPKALAADATAEQVTAWRAEQGLPKDAGAFLAGLALPNGVVPGEADKPLIASFAEAATKANWSQQQYNDALSWYYGLQDTLIADQQKGDEDFHIASTQDLQREWGTEFRGNLTRITQFMDAHFPKEVQAILLSARGPDGSIIGNHPAVNRAILEVAKFVNPAAAVLPNIAGATMTNVHDRITEIEGNMRSPQNSDKWTAYWKGEGGARMQQELRDLYTARETMKERQGAGR